MAKKKKKKSSFQSNLFLVFGMVLSVVLLPTTVLLVVGLLPTFVAFLVDRSQKKTKVLTVGSMNLAGCTPFLFELWMRGNDFERSIDIMLNPTAITVMYSAAAAGYLIDWGMTSLVSRVMYHQGLLRQKDIKQRQKDLIERWGTHVTGDVPLDEHGFPKEKRPAATNGEEA